MSDENKITPEDLATKEDIEQFKEDVENLLSGGSSPEGDEGGSEPSDGDDPFDIDPSDIDEVVEKKTQAMLDHIADPEACDSPECESLRDKYGFTGEEADADEETEAEDDEEDEPERGMFGARLE